MFVSYYYLNLLRVYEGGNDSFLTLPVLVNMLFTKKDKSLVKNMFTLEGYNVKQLVRGGT